MWIVTIYLVIQTGLTTTIVDTRTIVPKDQRECVELAWKANRSMPTPRGADAAWTSGQCSWRVRA